MPTTPTAAQLATGLIGIPRAGTPAFNTTTSDNPLIRGSRFFKPTVSKEESIQATLRFIYAQAHIGMPDITDQELTWLLEYYKKVEEAVYPNSSHLPKIEEVLAELILRARNYLDPTLVKQIRDRFREHGKKMKAYGQALARENRAQWLAEKRAAHKATTSAS